MKIASIIGARPQFIKIAPLHPEISRRHDHLIIHTGQHYDYEMSQVFFDELEIPTPDYNLGVGSASHAEQTGRMLVAVEKVLIEEKPDVVMVYGDTNSTLAGALASVKIGIPIAHVEAGLRSHRMDMPEEVNRVLTDHISSLLLCPSKVAVENLAKEGISGNVRLVGDTMVQCLLENQKKLNDSALHRFGLRKRGYVLATFHRQENVDSDDSLKAIVEAVLRHRGDVVLPLHPRTMKRLRSLSLLSELEKGENVKVLPPLNFLAFMSLEKNAKVILTDSGGVQKEAYFFGVPCVTARKETEWLETIEEGWNVLVGTDPGKMLKALEVREPTSRTRGTYGDWDVSRRIVESLSSLRKVDYIDSLS